MTPTNLDKLRRDGPYGSAAYRLLNTELIGPEDDRLTVTMWARLPLSSSRRYQIRDGAGALLYDTDDCHDSGNALHAAMMWLGERQKQYDALHAPDPTLAGPDQAEIDRWGRLTPAERQTDLAAEMATDAMHGPKDQPGPEAETLDEALLQIEVEAEIAAMTPEEQEKALAHLDQKFEADRQKVISEVMGMVQEPKPQ